MLVNYILYVFVAIVTIVAILFGSIRLNNYYKSSKGKEMPYSLQIPFFCLMMALIFGFFFLPRVHIVSVEGHKEKILIGAASVNLDNGDKVSILGKGVVNNSPRHIYVETLDYIAAYRKDYHRSILVEKISPYSVYRGKIDYTFGKPPETIRTSPLSPSTKRKLLRESTFGEEK